MKKPSTMWIFVLLFFPNITDAADPKAPEMTLWQNNTEEETQAAEKKRLAIPEIVVKNHDNMTKERVVKNAEEIDILKKEFDHLKHDKTQAALQEYRNESQREIIDEKIASFKSISNWVTWLINAVLGAFALVLGFLTFKNFSDRREFKADQREFKTDMEKTVNEAKEARDNAKNYEDEAQKTLKDIKQKHSESLDELKEETKKHVDDIFQQAEKQRKLSKTWDEALKAAREGRPELVNELWGEITKEPLGDLERYSAFVSWGNGLRECSRLDGADKEKLLQDACEKYQKATEIKEDCHEAFNNWGVALRQRSELKGTDKEKLLREACEKYKKATDSNKDKHEAFNNWGVALRRRSELDGADKEKLLREACEKYKKATEIKEDCHEAFNNWGVVLLIRAQLDGAAKEELLDEAEEMLEKAELIQTGCAAYNLACMWAMRGNEQKCKEWLELGEEKGTLETREHAMNDDDLKSVREKEWFKEIKWKGEK